MPGKPGSGGPVPKRSDQRRRRNDTGVQQVQVAGAAVVWPDPDPDWHEVAQDWFRSLGESGQAQFFQPSDRATARYVAQAMSQSLTAGKVSAMLFAAVMSASAELLATEGSRRRLRIELERGPAEPPAAESAAVANLADKRRAMENRTG